MLSVFLASLHPKVIIVSRVIKTFSLIITLFMMRPHTKLLSFDNIQNESN